MRKGIVIFATLAILLGGYFMYEGYRPVPLAPQESTESSPSDLMPYTRPAVPEDDTTDWQTYRNEKYGFEFKYPSSSIWQVIVLYDDNGIDKVLVTNHESKSSISIYPFQAHPGESIFDSQKPSTSQQIFFVGRTAKMYTCPEQSPCLFGRFMKAIRLIDVPRGWGNQNEIKIEVWDGIDKQAQNMQNDLEGILDTFRFIN